MNWDDFPDADDPWAKFPDAGGGVAAPAQPAAKQPPGQFFVPPEMRAGAAGAIPEKFAQQQRGGRPIDFTAEGGPAFQSVHDKLGQLAHKGANTGDWSEYHNYLAEVKKSGVDRERMVEVNQPPGFFQAQDMAAAAKATPDSILPDSVRAVQNQMVAAAGDVGGLIGRVIGDEGASDEAHRISNQLRAQADVYTNRSSIPGIGPASQAAGMLFKALPVAAATGGAGLIAESALERGSTAVQEGRAAGLQGMGLAKYSTKAAVIEGATTALLQKFGTVLGNKIPFLKGLQGTEGLLAPGAGTATAKQILARTGVGFVGELAEEESINFLDALNQSTSGVNPGAMNPDQLWKGFVETAKVTAWTMGLGNTPAAISMGTQAWARRNPDAAAAIAALPPNPSRKQMADAGVDPEGSSVAQREAARQSVVEALAPSEQDANLPEAQVVTPAEQQAEYDQAAANGPVQQTFAPEKMSADPFSVPVDVQIKRIEKDLERVRSIDVSNLSSDEKQLYDDRVKFLADQLRTLRESAGDSRDAAARGPVQPTFEGEQPTAPQPDEAQTQVPPTQQAATPQAKTVATDAEAIMEKVRREANTRDLNDHERELQGVNIEDRSIPKAVGEKFWAHGLHAKDLLSLLRDGIDRTRKFFSEPLAGGEGLLRSFQSFLVVGHPGKRIEDGGIRAVIVDPLHSPNIPDLQRAFPGVEFIPAKQSAARLAEIANEAQARPTAPTAKRTSPEQAAVEAQAQAELDGVRARYKETSGYDLPDLTEPTEEHADAQSFYDERGKKVKFFNGDAKHNSFYDQDTDTVYVNSSRKGDDLWYVVGHEYAHASGADQRLADLPEAVIKKAQAEYLSGVNVKYRAKLRNNPERLRREAVATFIGNVLKDPKRREQLRKGNPTTWQKIVDAVRSFFADPESRAAKRVLKELQVKGEGKAAGSSQYAPAKRSMREDVRHAEATLDAERREQPRDTPTADENRATGAAKVQGDYEGTYSAIVKAGEEKQPLSADLVNAYPKILDTEYDRGMQSGDMSRFEQLQQAYRRSRSATGSALQAGNDAISEPESRRAAILDLLGDPGSRWQRPLKKAQDRADRARQEFRDAGGTEGDLDGGLMLSNTPKTPEELRRGMPAEASPYVDQKIQEWERLHQQAPPKPQKPRDPNKPLSPAQQRQKAKVEAVRAVREMSPRLRRARKELTEAQKQLAVVQKRVQESNDKVRDKLTSLGYDLNDLQSIAGNRVQFEKFLRAMEASKGRMSDVAYEFYRSWGLMSSPSSQIANILGPWVDMLKSGISHPLEATLNALTRNKTGAQLGEYKYILSAINLGLARKAGASAAATFRNELSDFRLRHDAEQEMRDIGKGAATTGKLGKLNRLWFNLNQAHDDLVKTVRGEVVVGGIAYRNGKDNGLSGAELEKFILSETTNATSKSWQEAVEAANAGTLSDKGGAVSRGLDTIANKIREFDIPVLGKPLRFLLPFVHTPLRAFARGIEGSYMDTPGFLLQVGKNLKGGKHALDGASARAVRQGVAYGLMWAVWSAVGDSDDEDTWLTGKDEKRPYSIKIGGKWYSYARIDPFATTLGITADFIKALKSGDAYTAAVSPLATLKDMTKEKTMLQAVGDVFRILDAPEGMTEDRLADWAAGFAAGWVPNIVRSAIKASEPTQTETRSVGQPKGPQGSLQRLVDKTLTKMEVPAALGYVTDQPKVGLFGEERSQALMDRPATDFWFRVFAPTRGGPADVHPGYRFIYEWNKIAPEGKEIGDKGMDPQVTHGGVTVKLNPEQFVQMQKRAGTLASDLYSEYAKNLDAKKPTAEGAALLEKIFTRAKDVARDELKAELYKANPAAFQKK